MLEWLALPIIAVAGLMPGWLAVRLLSQRHSEQADGLEVGLAALTLGLVMVGWLALVLVEIGYYSLGTLAALWLVTTAVLALLTWKRRLSLSSRRSSTFAKGQRPFLILWFIAALWLWLRPHQFITGGGDAGVYVNLGVNIAHTGRLLIHDDALAHLDPALHPAVLRPVRNPVAETYLLPAFYVTDVAAGEITPQFYPLHPVWYAIAYGLGGVMTELRLTGLWALLASLAVYLLVRQISRWQVAALALAALSLNAMQVWFGRYPASESLTQYLLWAGLWATAVWLSDRPPARLWALLAGASLGSLFLVRIDVLFLLPVLALVIVWQWRRRQPGLAWFALPLGLLAAHSLLHALWQSQPYFFDLYRFAILSLTRGEGGLALLTAVGLLVLGLFAYFYVPLMRLLAAYRQPLLALAIMGLLALAVYSWFIRPYAPILTYADQFSGGTLPQLDHENFIRLGWYLSPLGVWLGVLGICLLVWRVNWQTAVMLLVTLFFSLFYLWSLRNNPTQIYAMRRYVPATLPLFVMGASYAVGWLFFPSSHRLADGRLRLPTTILRLLAITLACLWLGGTALAARGFVSQVDYAGLPAQLAVLVGSLDENAVLLWHDQSPVGMGDHLGTPLKFQYGFEVYSLRDLEALDEAALVRTIEAWQNSGRTVYWVGDPTWLTARQLTYTETSVTLTSSYLEGSTGHKPTAVLPISWTLHIAKLK